MHHLFSMRDEGSPGAPADNDHSRGCRGSAKRARWVDSPSSGFFSSLSTTGDDADGELESALSAARRKLADVKGRQSSLGTVPALEAAFEIADDDEEQAEDEDEDLPFVSGSSAMLYAAT